MEPQQLCAIQKRRLGKEGKEQDVAFEAGIIKEFKSGWAIDCGKGRQTLVRFIQFLFLRIQQNVFRVQNTEEKLSFEASLHSSLGR